MKKKVNQKTLNMTESFFPKVYTVKLVVSGHPKGMEGDCLIQFGCLIQVPQIRGIIKNDK